MADLQLRQEGVGMSGGWNNVPPSQQKCHMNTAAQREVNRLCNRHKARLLHDLEVARCPTVFKNAVINELNYLRSDLAKVDGSINRSG